MPATAKKEFEIVIKSREWTYLKPNGDGRPGFNEHFLVSPIEASVPFVQCIFKRVTAPPVHTKQNNLFQLLWRKGIGLVSVVVALWNAGAATTAANAALLDRIGGVLG